MGDIWPYGPPTHVSWNEAYAAMNSLGQTPEDCAVYAAIAQAESGLDRNVINDTPATGDYSVGLWQINYYGSLYGPRAAAYGTPQQLIAGGTPKQALAAISIGANGFTPWSTYNNGDYLQYLNGNVPPSGAPPGGGTPPTIQEGSTGPYVQQLQSQLNVLGYGLAVDGDFGPLTRAAVVTFQGRQGIAQDGIVGPITWQHLADAVAAAQGGGSPGPTTLPPGSTPPSEPPGNADPATVGAWSDMVEGLGPTYNAGLSGIYQYTQAIGGMS